MLYYIFLVAGIIVGILWDRLTTDSGVKKITRYEQNAIANLQEFNKKVQTDLSNAQEEFAKMQLTKLLYEVLKDIFKEIK